MKKKELRGHAAGTYIGDMRREQNHRVCTKENVARTYPRDMLQVYLPGICCMDMPQGHVAGTHPRDMLQGHVLETCCRDTSKGYAAELRLRICCSDTFQGYPAWIHPRDAACRGTTLNVR